ncbi:hypothetical protein ACFL5O_03930 [Myxococcota bacterium]
MTFCAGVDRRVFAFALILGTGAVTACGDDSDSDGGALGAPRGSGGRSMGVAVQGGRQSAIPSSSAQGGRFASGGTTRTTRGNAGGTGVMAQMGSGGTAQTASGGIVQTASGGSTAEAGAGGAARGGTSETEAASGAAGSAISAGRASDGGTGPSAGMTGTAGTAGSSGTEAGSSGTSDGGATGHAGSAGTPGASGEGGADQGGRGQGGEGGAAGGAGGDEPADAVACEDRPSDGDVCEPASMTEECDLSESRRTPRLCNCQADGQWECAAVSEGAGGAGGGDEPADAVACEDRPSDGDVCEPASMTEECDLSESRRTPRLCNCQADGQWECAAVSEGAGGAGGGQATNAAEEG